MENVRQSLLVRRPIYSRQVRHRQSLFRTSHRNNLYGHGIWEEMWRKARKTRKAPAGGSMLYWSCGVTSFFIIIAWRGWKVKVIFPLLLSCLRYCSQALSFKKLWFFIHIHFSSSCGVIEIVATNSSFFMIAH